MNNQELIFQRALQSKNRAAVLDVARVFNELGEKEKSQALIRHTYSFGAEANKNSFIDFIAHVVIPIATNIGLVYCGMRIERYRLTGM
jgi:hypothetical protein